MNRAASLSFRASVRGTVSHSVVNINLFMQLRHHSIQRSTPFEERTPEVESIANRKPQANPELVPDDEEKLQDHWRAMENRVKLRKSKKDGPRGRTGLRTTAWDHENV